MTQTLNGTYLGVEKVQNREEACVGAGKEEIGSPTNLLVHDGNNHDNSKVEEPVGTGGNSVGLGTSLEGVDLGRVQPGERKPSGTERGNVGEETDSGTLGGGLGTGEQTGKGQDHGEELANGSVEEKIAATNALNEEPGKGGKDTVDNHVDTTEKHSHVVGVDDLVLEENGEIVDDGVATSELLHELGSGTEHHATEVLCTATGEESLDGSALLATEARGADGVDNKVNLLLGLGAVDIEATDGSDDGGGLFVSLMGEKPSRRLGEPDHGDAKNETKEDLESNGESPDEVIRTVRRTIVDPVGDEGTKGNDTTLDTDEKTSVGGLAALGLIGRDGGGVDTVSDTGDDTTDDELGELAAALDSSDLDNNTEDHNGTTEDHGASSTDKITKSENEHGTEQATDFVNGSDETSHSLVLTLGEEFDKGGSRDNTRHNTLTVVSTNVCGHGDADIP